MKTLALSALAGFGSWLFGLALQGTTGLDPGNLIQFGALGAVLAWMMATVTPQLKAFGEDIRTAAQTCAAAVDRNTRALNVQALSNAQVLEQIGSAGAAREIRKQVEGIQAEVDTAEKERAK